MHAAINDQRVVLSMPASPIDCLSLCNRISNFSQDRCHADSTGTAMASDRRVFTAYSVYYACSRLQMKQMIKSSVIVQGLIQCCIDFIVN